MTGTWQPRSNQEPLFPTTANDMHFDLTTALRPVNHVCTGCLELSLLSETTDINSKKIMSQICWLLEGYLKSSIKQLSFKKMSDC